MIVFSICILLGGFISDYVGRKKVITYTKIFMILSFGPLFYLVSNANEVYYIYIYMFLLSIAFGLYVGASSTLFAEIFDINIRATALSLSYNIPYAIVGGLTPALLSSVLFHGNYLYIILITILVLLVAFITSLYMKETYKKNI